VHSSPKRLQALSHKITLRRSWVGMVGAGGWVKAQHRGFWVRGQLGMLNSLGISSPCCWSVFCALLRRWSRSLPAFLSQTITRNERESWRGWKGGVFFYPLWLNGEKRDNVLLPSWLPWMKYPFSVFWRCARNKSQAPGTGWRKVNTVSRSQSAR